MFYVLFRRFNFFKLIIATCFHAQSRYNVQQEGNDCYLHALAKDAPAKGQTRGSEMGEARGWNYHRSRCNNGMLTCTLWRNMGNTRYNCAYLTRGLYMVHLHATTTTGAHANTCYVLSLCQ